MSTQQGKGKGPKKKCPDCGKMYNANYVRQHRERVHTDDIAGLPNAVMPEVVAKAAKQYRAAKNNGSIKLTRAEVELYQTADGRLCLIEWLT